MGRFAEGTSVSVERSKAEAEKILTRYCADQCSMGWTTGRAIVMFRMKNRYVRIEIPLPTIALAGPFTSTEKVAAETRRRWRALVLYLKATLEAVESEVVMFEDAFMSHIVLPNKQTVGEFTRPQIEAAYGSGKMPTQLPGW